MNDEECGGFNAQNLDPEPDATAFQRRYAPQRLKTR
jgi:hypothetical protein